MIKKLSELNGVSGNEEKVREFIIAQIKDYVDDITIDTMGNLIAFKKGKKGGNKPFAIVAHMDEIGFIISKITDDGYLKFKNVGGIDKRILLTQRVVVGDKRVPGVIGVKAVHLQTKDEHSNVIKTKDMYIDIGATSREDALKFVKMGDYAAFDSKYVEFGNSLFKGKALDDRVGCAALISAVQKTYDADIYFLFSVQEEVGLRGAKVLSRRVNANYCVVVEGTNAADIPFVKDHETVTKLGDGPSVSIMDRASYSNKRLNKFIMDLAKENNIKYQIKKSVAGGNDAGALSIGAEGCETAVVSLPVRYIHSPVCVANKNDFAILTEFVCKICENIHTYNPVTKEVIK